MGIPEGVTLVAGGVMCIASPVQAAEDFIPFFGDLELWALVAFLGFLWAIKALGLWDVLLRSMSARERRETELIAGAENFLAQASEEFRQSRGQLEALDETIRGILEEAERDAEYTRNEITGSAQREANVHMERAQHEIERVKEQSVHDLFQALAERVTETTEQRLRNNLKPDDHARLIDETLATLTK
jgi:F-type H+-transporting ATPase subunit b